MAKIIDIATREVVSSERQQADSVGPVASGPAEPGRRGYAVLTFTAAALRGLIFLVLYWLRLPVMLVCQLVSVPLLFAFLFSLYAFGDKHAMVYGFGVLSFAAFAVLWLYDALLMWLSPQDMIKSI